MVPRGGARRILISGFDGHARFDRDFDERGASWIFTREPLSPDHGFPARLVVPGGYGCCCIKWVNAVRFVKDRAPSTRHMREFAGRTHQDGVPKLAGQFRAATIDTAAMPVRVERWAKGKDAFYRVVGILRGGERTTDRLVIRFGPGEPYVPVESCHQRTTRTWTLWSHTWRPKHPGRYTIELQVDDPRVPTRRLDRGDYRRSVTIDGA